MDIMFLGMLYYHRFYGCNVILSNIILIDVYVYTVLVTEASGTVQTTNVTGSVT